MCEWLQIENVEIGSSAFDCSRLSVAVLRCFNWGMFRRLSSGLDIYIAMDNPSLVRAGLCFSDKARETK